MTVLAYRPGDVLRRTDWLGLDHDAIADTEGGVIRQVFGRGVVRERLAEFDAEGAARVVELRDRRFDHAETLSRAQAAIGAPDYNLFTDNCQHFASWCATGERNSHQVQGALSAATIAAGIAAVARLATPAGLAVTAGAALAYLARNAIAARLGAASATSEVVTE
ncbi:MAG: lecithin retinol acyltransferase family protein [Alphaproteobacteria bacterium]|nr:lecithin retinol acyltransferase family protein [Alphaproteobacteria bacterium]